MTKRNVNILIIVGVLLLIIVLMVAPYNSMVSKQQSVKDAWGNVENQYQRRSDLIPNLVNTVKGYATHEKTTLEEVTNARARATQITVNPDNLSSEQLQKYQRAQGDLTTALGKLLAISENYPNLKANENFIELQAQLEGTENRISVARHDFNDATQGYNSYILKFPQVVIAHLFGFNEKGYFEAEKGAEKAPQVKF